MTFTDVAIVGAGFGGLGAAIRLAQAGRRNFLILEAADDVGGTWQANTYPGCACDVPSHLYSFSFAPNPDWSDTFSGQREIWEYLRGCVDRFGLRAHLRTGHAVEEARWDESARNWRITTSRGEFTARVLISAAGPLSAPAVPDITGLDGFSGTVFHSARWRHDHDLTGRRVAVIGTGASAAQFIPAIAPDVRRLVVFQRTPGWVLPRPSRRTRPWERRLFRALPPTQRAVRAWSYWAREALGLGFLHPRLNGLGQRVALRHLRRQVADPQVRAELTPDYVLGCKRVLLSNDYYPSLVRSNVDLVTTPVDRVLPGGIRTADGAEHPVDTIILGTGFRVTDPPIAHRIRGRGGRTLAQAWHEEGMNAYLGTSAGGFPNLFLLLGPNTGLGHTSVVLMIESQLAQILGALRFMDRSGVDALEPTAEAQRSFADWVRRRTGRAVWSAGGCRSWYLDQHGNNVTVWPGFATGYRLRMRRFRPDDYRPAPGLGTVDPAPVGAESRSL